ncbi:MAG: fibrinogen-like YCDxxxxGGGW domain-containing protein [Candidatus Aenigmatarchaeota archaeon]
MGYRGITPVISLIMLMLITVGIVGMAGIYINNFVNSKISGVFSISYTFGSKIVARNDGSGQIYNVTVSIDGQPVSTKFVTGAIDPGKAGSIVLLSESIPIGDHDITICANSMCNSRRITVNKQGSGRNCLEILNSGGSTGNGVYTIKPDGVTEIQAYCDMLYNEGGWTLAAVCKASEANNCYTTAAKGSVTDPNSATSTKLSDSNIKATLVNGEKTTRAYWRQQNRYGGSNPVTAAIFNNITVPNSWTSDGCGSNGQEFYSKYSYVNSISADINPISGLAYASSWGSAIYSLGTGCSCAVSGWSNTQRDSCGFATWTAGCEAGPAMNHDCATPIERADVVLWIR